MKPTLISCIVPVFNGERYLHESLESILAQTYRPLEVIVADDGSTDGTAGSMVNGFDITFSLMQDPQPHATWDSRLHEVTL